MFAVPRPPPVRVTIDWIQLAALVGAVQGFLLAGVLVAHRTNRTANRLLAALMVAFTVYLLSAVYYAVGLIRTYPHFFGISYPLPWVFGPLVYLYAVAASDRGRRFRARDALHFLPLLVVVLVGLPVYLASGAEKIALFDRLQAGDTPRWIATLEPFKYLSGLSYSAMTVAYLRRHWRRVEQSYSNTERVNLRWLLWLSAGAAATWLLAFSTRAADVVPAPVEPYRESLVALAIALLVYAIGYMGLRQPEIFRYDEPEPSAPSAGPPPRAEPAAAAPVDDARAETPVESPVESPVETSAAAAADVPGDARYERSGLGEAEARELKAALLALMARERPYRDPDLTLPTLAERLSTTPHKLSEVLNAELSQTFYDFVNGYRVDDVRRRLAEAESRHLNVLALAMDAGFASKSTFNQVFKKLTGQTPSTYRKELAGA
jgi:AraC-like DNA-binding protein